MTGAELARAVANVAWEVLQTLTTAFKPWAMADLSSRVGVPPIDLGADWTAAVEQARQDLDGLDGAEWWHGSRRWPTWWSRGFATFWRWTRRWSFWRRSGRS
jgi:hypothetical protein